MEIKNMFSSKKNSLFIVESKKEGSLATNGNQFISAGLKKSSETLSENGALKYSTTGDVFVDQFSKLGSYKTIRSFDDISKDMMLLYSTDKVMAVKFILYIRLITRKTMLLDGTKTESVQRGAGLKHEAIMRMIWLYVHDKREFENNIGLFISAGSWKDIFTILSYDLEYNGWEGRILNWDFMGKVILAGLENTDTTNLVRKYLPQIKANIKCTTIESQADNIISKWVCSLLFGPKVDDSGKTYKVYRKLKTNGTAHDWQKLISQKKHDLVNFDTVHGRALAQMVSSKYLQNQKLVEKYEKWIESKPIAKYTGYPHELFQKPVTKRHEILTLNAQFMGLVETAKMNASENTGMIVVRDTSGSMRSMADGTNMSCFNIAKALALFFSEMIDKGRFANSWIEFNSRAKMHNWVGRTPYEKWSNDHSGYVGSTNFLSVIDLFGDIKRTGVPESEFPIGIICISDNEFNPAQLGKTNVDAAMSSLRSHGFSEEYISKFKIVLWNLQRRGGGHKFETYGNVENVYYFSGYDASVIAFLTGVEVKGEVKNEPKNAKELFLAAMDQEILNMVNIG